MADELIVLYIPSFGCHSPGDMGILNTVDPLALVSNYNIVAKLSIIIILLCVMGKFTQLH